MLYFYYHTIVPVIFKIGPITLHWYGVMYGIGFLFSMWFLFRYRERYFNKSFVWTIQEMEYLLYLNIFGVLFGGRIGYVILYQWEFFTKNFFWIFNIWEGGMSFHGGLIGVIVAIALFAYKKRQEFLWISDFIVPAVPFGLGLGRIGNFINGELWGKIIVSSPIAVLFPGSRYQDILIFQNYPQWQLLFHYYGVLPRHPSQLYEMFLEGIVLFVVINMFIRRPHPVGSISGLFLLCYGIFRVIAEFFREPDYHLGFICNMITMGQILSIPMIIAGMIIIYFSYKK